jgi:hypothetical protein
MRRLALAGALAAGALLVPHAQAAAKPQVTDPAGDANFSAAAGGQEAAVGNQAYADVLSVEWKSVKKKGKVTAFQVITTLSSAPTPPQGTSIVYRMLGKTPKCGFFGVAYYTKQHSDASLPQSAVRDNCIDATTRLTKIALPVIAGSTITWTVPVSVIPKDTGVKVGSILTDLHFTVFEIEDFGGPCVPDLSAVPDEPEVPILGSAGVGAVVRSYSKACGLGAGQVEGGTSTATYKIA